MAYTYNRRQTDSTLSVSIALPNAANTVNTNGIDLGNVATAEWPLTEHYQVQLSNTVGTGANSKNINYALQDSADNATFANISALAIQVVAGNAANAANASVVWTLPPTVRRYIRGTATGEANGGNSSDGTLTVQLLF